MIERDADAMELKQSVYDDYNARLDERMAKVLYEEERGGGGSYYVNRHGRSGTQMPWKHDEFYAMVRKPNPEDYIYG